MASGGTLLMAREHRPRGWGAPASSAAGVWGRRRRRRSCRDRRGCGSAGAAAGPASARVGGRLRSARAESSSSRRTEPCIRSNRRPPCRRAGGTTSSNLRAVRPPPCGHAAEGGRAAAGAHVGISGWEARRLASDPRRVPDPGRGGRSDLDRPRSGRPRRGPGGAGTRRGRARPSRRLGRGREDARDGALGEGAAVALERIRSGGGRKHPAAPRRSGAGWSPRPCRAVGARGRNRAGGCSRRMMLLERVGLVAVDGRVPLVAPVIGTWPTRVRRSGGSSASISWVAGGPPPASIVARGGPGPRRPRGAG